MSMIKKLNENATSAIGPAVIPNCYGRKLDEKHNDCSNAGLTSFSSEYPARDVERAYDIAYGTGATDVKRGS